MMPVRRAGKKKGNDPIGRLMGGCGLWIFVLVAWGIFHFLVPKAPDYAKTMERGETVPGTILRVEEVENVTINGSHPKRVFFEFGEGRQGSMTMAMNESAGQGQEIQVRVLGAQAYPEGIRPMMTPGWVKFVLAGGFILGGLIIASGVFRLLLVGGMIGGGLLAWKHAYDKKENKSSPPPPPPA